MATILYFRDIVSTNAPTAGSKSIALPNGTDNSVTTNDNQSMLLDQHATETTVSITTIAQTARQSARFARFTSEVLATQTISANTWNYQLRNRHSNNSANAYKAGSIYVWRPSTSSVVGYIYDSSAEIGTRWTTNFTNDNSTITGSAVSVLEGDVLVCEVWYTAAQTKAASYTVEIQYNTNSYIETPQDLTFFSVSSEQTFGTIIE
jgi:hypothetical protein